MFYELLFLKSLALTIMIEMSIMAIYFKFIDKLKDAGIYKILITGFICSFATLPYLWFILPNFIDNQTLYVIASESFAVLVETFIIAVILRIKLIRSFLCSFACNMISFLTGLIIY